MSDIAILTDNTNIGILTKEVMNNTYNSHGKIRVRGI